MMGWCTKEKDYFGKRHSWDSFYPLSHFWSSYALLKFFSIVESKYIADGERLMYLVRCGNSHPNISFHFTLLIKMPANMLSVLCVLETRLHFFSVHMFCETLTTQQLWMYMILSRFIDKKTEALLGMHYDLIWF